MVQMGELAWVYIVVMWVTVGNGMRFGNHYLYVAVAMAMVSFGCTVMLTPYWQQNFRLAIGLWLAWQRCRCTLDIAAAADRSDGRGAAPARPRAGS